MSDRPIRLSINLEAVERRQRHERDRYKAALERIAQGHWDGCPHGVDCSNPRCIAFGTLRQEAVASEDKEASDG